MPGKWGAAWTAVLLCIAGIAEAQIEGVVGPPRAVTIVDAPVTLGAETFDGITIVGDAAPGEVIRVAADAGTVSLGGVDGLVFVDGDGVLDGAMGFTGETPAIVAALDGLTGHPAPASTGLATLTVEVEGGPGITVPMTVNAALDADGARAVIGAGVDSIHGGVQPGRVVAFGPSATEIGWFDGDAGQGAVIGAARWGAGRVIAVNDHQSLNMHSYGEQSGPFFRNGIAWLADRAGLDPTIVTLSQGVGDWLSAEGYANVVVTNAGGLPVALVDADVLIPPWLGNNPGQGTLDAVTDFVRGGGGLFIADYGPGYRMWWGTPIPDATGNRLLRAAGLGFPDGIRWDEGVVQVIPAISPMTYDVLLEMLADVEPFGAEARARGGALLDRLAGVLPVDDPLLLRLDARFDAAVAGVSATPQSPVRDPWYRSLLRREIDQLKALAPDDIRPHRTAEALYGPVPPDAPRIERSIRIAPSRTRWHATGVYAAPGDVIEVDTPIDAIGLGFRVRIGGHTDDMGPRDVWLRSPVVHWWADLADETTRIASPFGGAVYIDVGTQRTDTPPFEVTIRGAVPAPFFVLGEMTDAQWLAEQRGNPAPYAELVGNNLAISLPSSMVQNLDRPTTLMDFWDRVVEAQDTLGGAAHTRTNAERINIDVQVSAGYLHAGYPTQGPLVAGPELTDVDRVLRQGSWGWFHELGHEAQRLPDKVWGWDNPFTFDGSVEATVNIFTTYAYDHTEAVATGGWGWTGPRVDVMRRAIERLAGGGIYAEVDVGVKLAMFLQLKNFFGWQTLELAFATYVADHPDGLPGNNAEERDQWLIRASQAAGHDLTLFMQGVWGLELSPEAIATVADLPEWMPALGGIEGRFRTVPGASLTFDLVGEALSHDGVAVVSQVGEGDGAPQGGVIVDEGDGRFTYAAEAGFSGLDSFTYVVTSSTGHEVVSRIEIDVADAGIVREVWYGIPGSDLAALRADARWPDAPDERTIIDGLSSPADVADSYGVRLRGLIVPPSSGAYTFWVASDDQGELWLSPDHTAEGAELIARVAAWVPAGVWDGEAGQRSAPVELVAGRAYYVEALMKEGGGGDHLSVAWARDDGVPGPVSPDVLRPWRPENAPPIAVPDAGEVALGDALEIDVLANDRDPDGDRLVLISVDGPGASIEAGRLRFTPRAGVVGEMELSYVVGDGHGGETRGEVVVSVFDPLAIELRDPADGAWVGERCVTLRWNAANPEARHVISIEGNETVIPRGETRFEACLGDGVHAWQVMVIEGENTSASALWRVGIDTAPPELAEPVEAPEDWHCPQDEMRLRWAEAWDAGSGVGEAPYTVRIGDAPAVLLGARTYAFPRLPDGRHPWRLEIRDRLDNMLALEGELAVDCTPPEVAEAAGARLHAGHGLDNPIDTGLVVDAGDTIRVVASGMACHGADPGCGPGLSDELVCAGPAGLGDGPEEWPLGRLLVGVDGVWLDAVGGEDPVSDTTLVAPAGGAVSLALATNGGDCSRPTIDAVVIVGDGLAPLRPAPGAISTLAEPEFAWQAATDAFSGVDGTTVWVGGEPVGPLAAGTHAWWLEAVDAVGNLASTEEWTVRVDLAPPSDFLVVSPEADAEVWGEVEVCWEGTDDPDPDGALDRYLLFVDDAYRGAVEEATCVALMFDTPGERCLRVVARDAAGRETSTDARCVMAEPLGAGCVDDDECPAPLVCLDNACRAEPEPDMAPPEVDAGVADMAPPEADMAPVEGDMAVAEIDMQPTGDDMSPVEADMEVTADGGEGASRGEASGCAVTWRAGGAWPLWAVLFCGFAIRRTRAARRG